MTKTMLKYGARKGEMNTVRGWIAKASAKDIRLFPVPGANILRMHENKLDLDFIIAPNPREANVLLVMGGLTDPLTKKAAVAYQQIPRPRVLVVAGPEPQYLPEPDVQLALKNDFLDEALPEARQLLKNYAWSKNAESWEPEFLKEVVEDSDNGGGHDHHHHDHGNGDGENGNEHDHGDAGHRHEGHEGHAGHDHSGHQHDKADDEPTHQHSNHDHGGHDHEAHQHDSHAEGEAQKSHSPSSDSEGEEENNHHSDDGGHEHDEGEHDHSGHSHDNDGHDGHDHGDMDFMSMVAMTKDLPRPKDGLPMNRSEVHFGPFHPGLPGGLSVFMELDGDTVIESHVEDELTAHAFEELLPVKAGNLPDLLAGLNPLTPQTYRLLAKKALANAFGNGGAVSAEDLVILEHERIASHLNWLATFGKTVGNEWMHQEATLWHRIIRKEEREFTELSSFLDQIRSMPYLQQKLSVDGVIPDQLLHHLSGPVAKAAGIKQDLRSDQNQYQNLGWEPVVKEENNGWGRLQVRLDEIEQSLEMINSVEQETAEKINLNSPGSGEGIARIESPRGTLSLRIVTENGMVEQLQIATPSKQLAGLVPTLTEEAELSDALAQIVSLDISPWEVGLKGSEVQ